MTIPTPIKAILGFTAVVLLGIVSTTAYAIHSHNVRQEEDQRFASRLILDAAIEMEDTLTSKEKMDIRTCIINSTGIKADKDCFFQKMRPDLAMLSPYELLRYNAVNNVRRYHWLSAETREAAIDCMNAASDELALDLCEPK